MTTRDRIQHRPQDPRHGTVNGYCNLHCRCELCRDAWAAYYRDLRYRRPALPPDDGRHGTRGGYENWQCRCQPCRDAHRVAAYTSPSRNRTPVRSTPQGSGGR